MMIDIAIHRNMLLKILKDIYTDKALGPMLGFKGGTAVYLFYNLDRFSVDLDFDLLNLEKDKEVSLKLENILKEYGTIKEKANKKYTLLVVLSYAKESQGIKIEVNKRDFGSRYEVKNYLGIPMLVMNKQDMAAHKMVAMTERGNTANRDIYDINFFLRNNWDINREIVEKRTGMEFIDYISRCIGFLRKIPERGMLSGMGELLSTKRKDWVKAHLKEDTIFLMNLLLDSEKAKP
jgi:predicted nucleotidyltransferase component of viral defense system